MLFYTCYLQYKSMKNHILKIIPSKLCYYSDCCCTANFIQVNFNGFPNKAIQALLSVFPETNIIRPAKKNQYCTRTTMPLINKIYRKHPITIWTSSYHTSHNRQWITMQIKSGPILLMETWQFFFLFEHQAQQNCYNQHFEKANFSMSFM